MRNVRHGRSAAGSAAAAVAALLAGCGAKHLVYVQEASLGIDASISGEGVSKLVLGFNRDVFALVPKLEDGSEAMTLTAVSRVSATGLDDVDFEHVVACGTAAIVLAQDEEGLAMIRRAVFEEGDE
jgi:hypothetical protein